MPTPGQVLHFNVFGFLLMRGYFSSSEMDDLRRKFDELLEEDREGQLFDGEERQAVFGIAERRPGLLQIAEDDRVFVSMEQLLGAGFVWSASDGNHWVGDTQWHPGRFDRSYPLIKTSFYLDPVTKETGSLRVRPGSHRMPLHENLKPLWRTRLAMLVEDGARPREELDTLYLPGEDRAAPPLGVPGPEMPSLALETDPGDVIFFHQNLWHASFGGRAGHRQMALSFGANPVADAQVSELRKLHETNLASARERGNINCDRLYGDG